MTVIFISIVTHQKKKKIVSLYYVLSYDFSILRSQIQIWETTAVDDVIK